MTGIAMPTDSTNQMAGLEMSGMSMSHAYSRNLPMSRNDSGTTWQPDQTPMYMWMQRKEP